MSHEPMRTTLLIQGARENNLRNITVELPRDKLVVISSTNRASGCTPRTT
jgi:excinuclease UvrABC ATPase subunit